MIGGLASSSSSSSSFSTKIIFEDFPRTLSRCGTEIFCLVPGKTFNVEILRFDSAQNTILKSLRSSFSFKASQVDLSAAETQTPEKYPTKTVHVRFQLQKECEFGEHFFILGDDPAFGLWEPENAIPLSWSDGHVWTVDLDMPVGKSIEYKFILKGRTGKIWWQPGQNRALETWETNNTITICEDWDNADLQRVFEEELVRVNQEGLESSVVSLDMPIVAENVSSTHSKEKKELNKNNSSVAGNKDEMLSASMQENLAAIVADNVGYVKDDSEASLSSDVQNERQEKKSNEPLAILDENGTEAATVTEEESPVLVPGLTPVSALEKEYMTDGGDEETSTTRCTTRASFEFVDEGETENSPEDMPVKESIECKGKTGKILCQPGQNRVLETWATSNTITICEDWENADLQGVFEDDLVCVKQEGLESSVFSSDMPIVAENVSSTHSKEKIELNKNNSSVAGNEVEVLTAGIHENPAAIVADNIGYMKDDSEASLGCNVQNERKQDNSNEPLAILDENGTEVAMVTEEESPVLVPGLTPVSSLEKEDMIDERDKETFTTHASVDEGEAENSMELDTEQETEGEREQDEEAKDEGHEVKGIEQGHYGVAEEEMVVLVKDIQWGCRTLHKLLNSFRLL